MARNGRQRQNTVVVDAIAIAMIREKDPRKILRREAGRGVLGESISQL
jgi:Mg/Co/Ni transporter MgtE